MSPPVSAMMTCATFGPTPGMVCSSSIWCAHGTHAKDVCAPGMQAPSRTTPARFERRRQRGNAPGRSRSPASSVPASARPRYGPCPQRTAAPGSAAAVGGSHQPPRSGDRPSYGRSPPPRSRGHLQARAPQPPHHLLPIELHTRREPWVPHQHQHLSIIGVASTLRTRPGNPAMSRTELEHVRRIALALPGVHERESRCPVLLHRGPHRTVLPPRQSPRRRPSLTLATSPTRSPRGNGHRRARPISPAHPPQRRAPSPTGSDSSSTPKPRNRRLDRGRLQCRGELPAGCPAQARQRTQPKLTT